MGVCRRGLGCKKQRTAGAKGRGGWGKERRRGAQAVGQVVRTPERDGVDWLVACWLAGSDSMGLTLVRMEYSEGPSS